MCLCCFVNLRKVQRVPQTVRREAIHRSGKTAPLAHDSQDCPPQLLDDTADRRPAAAGAERGQLSQYHLRLEGKMTLKRFHIDPLLIFFQVIFTAEQTNELMFCLEELTSSLSTTAPSTDKPMQVCNSC